MTTTRNSLIRETHLPSDVFRMIRKQASAVGLKVTTESIHENYSSISFIDGKSDELLFKIKMEVRPVPYYTFTGYTYHFHFNEHLQYADQEETYKVYIKLESQTDIAEAICRVNYSKEFNR